MAGVLISYSVGSCPARSDGMPYPPSDRYRGVLQCQNVRQSGVNRIKALSLSRRQTLIVHIVLQQEKQARFEQLNFGTVDSSPDGAQLLIHQYTSRPTIDFKHPRAGLQDSPRQNRRGGQSHWREASYSAIVVQI